MTPDSTATLLAFPQRPEDRLRRALRQLEAALEEQRNVVADFRANLASLSGAVSGLGGSLENYRHRLADTAGAAWQAHDAFRRLEDG